MASYSCVTLLNWMDHIMIPDNATVGDLMRLMNRRANVAIKDRCAAVVERRRGKSFRQIAKSIKRSVFFVKTWNDRFKDEGARCFLPTVTCPRQLKLSDAKRLALKQRILAGPEPDDLVVVFTRRDIQRIIAAEFQATYSLSAVSRLMRRLRLVRLRPRPQHAKHDPVAAERWLADTLPQALVLARKKNPGKRLETWFQDESRFGQKTRAVRIWAERGSRPRFTNQNGFKSAYIFGAVNPATGVHIGLVATHCDSDFMQLHLDEIGRAVLPDAHVVLVLDGAGWHHAKALRIPSNMTLCHLPPYTPELNPIERLWLRLKERYLSLRIFPDIVSIITAGVQAWNSLTAADVMSICRTGVAPVRL